MATYKRIDRGKESIRGLSEKTGLSIATIRRHTSLPRDEWLTKKASEREAILVYHDDEASTSTPSDDAPAAPAETAQQHRPPQQPTPTRTRSPRPDTHRMSPPPLTIAARDGEALLYPLFPVTPTHPHQT